MNSPLRHFTRAQLVLVAVCALAVVACVVAGVWLREGGPAGPSEAVPGAGPHVVQPIKVYVAGAVRAPGVYDLPPGARVEDAVVVAGGLAPGADEGDLNRAAFLADGQRLVIPYAMSSPPATTVGSTVPPPAANLPLPLSLNSATTEQLEALPGIGPVLAARIVARRQEVGGFSQVEDLLQVEGIGSGTLEKVRPYLQP